MAYSCFWWHLIHLFYLQFTKLVSDIGGILGIFIGVSAISFAEILYLCIDILVIVTRRKSLEEVEQKQQDGAKEKADNCDDMVIEEVELDISEENTNNSNK